MANYKIEARQAAADLLLVLLEQLHGPIDNESGLKELARWVETGIAPADIGLPLFAPELAALLLAREEPLRRLVPS
jgi:hypothetical protein